jgi:dienelactone hydrolase
MSKRWLLDGCVANDEGFRAALVFYPGCARLRDKAPEYRPYAPVRMYLAGKDLEVNPRTCAKFAQSVAGGERPLELVEYAKAYHNFDDPGSEDPDDQEAAEKAREDAVAFFAAELGS